MPASPVVLSALVLLAGCISPVIPFGGGKRPPRTQYAAEKMAAERMLPAALGQPTAHRPASPHVLRLRVWVDKSYQRRVGWRAHVGDIIRRVNGYTTPAFGVILEGDIRAWDRDSDGSEPMQQTLTELMAHDDGDGVDHVVAMVGALPVASMVHHDLGLAEVAGKHFVLRAMNNAAELREMERAFPSLGKRERLEVHDQRTAHKEEALFVHEWAHNYGVMHEQGDAWIMSPSYHHRAGSLSEVSARLLALSLAARRGDAEAAAALGPHILGAEADWPAAQRRYVAAMLAKLHGQPEPPPPEAPPADEDTQAIEAADRLREASRLAEALAALDKVAPKTPAGWRALGAAYDRLGAFSRAETALGRAGADVTEVRQRRRQRGVFGVAPEKEPAATAAVESAHEAYVAEDSAAATRRVRDGLARFPRLAGLLAVRCGVELDLGHRGAEASCRKALAVSDETALAHLLLGHILAHSRRQAEAVPHLERAIALDATTESAYPPLAALYAERGETAKLGALRASFQARFRRSLD